jgi:hypothetical protein
MVKFWPVGDPVNIDDILDGGWLKALRATADSAGPSWVAGVRVHPDTAYVLRRRVSVECTDIFRVDDSWTLLGLPVWFIEGILPGHIHPALLWAPGGTGDGFTFVNLTGDTVMLRRADRGTGRAGLIFEVPSSGNFDHGSTWASPPDDEIDGVPVRELAIDDPDWLPDARPGTFVILRDEQARRIVLRRGCRPDILVPSDPVLDDDGNVAWYQTFNRYNEPSVGSRSLKWS